jgi:nonsense-mediated mRNA decay protein 3
MRSGAQLPDFILVRKHYPDRRKKNRKRAWKLKQLSKEIEDGVTASGKKSRDVQRNEADMELFMRDLEEDPELRSQVQLIKGKNQTNKKANKQPWMK